MKLVSGLCDIRTVKPGFIIDLHIKMMNGINRVSIYFFEVNMLKHMQ